MLDGAAESPSPSGEGGVRPGPPGSALSPATPARSFAGRAPEGRIERFVHRVLMGRGFVYILTLAFVASFAYLTARVILTDGVTIVVVAALVVLTLVVFGALGAMGGRGGRRQ